MSPYASVIIPTHDRAATLPMAVASVQRQTVADIEIIIVGDGPTPDVVAAAETLIRTDSRVRFLACDKAPGDGGINIDRAVHEAQSERIFYNDDDDVWLPQHVEALGPLLNHADIADTLPVSVGTIRIRSRQNLHGTLVNSGNSLTRQLLAEDRLKLTFDTHIAHRKSSYIELGSPRAVTSGISVRAMLSAFASARRIRWTTVPTATALSLHGAARVSATPMERRAEIETWLARSASWTPALLLERVDFTWHSVRTWFTEAPLADDSVADYLARYGIAWEPAATSGAGDDGAALAIPLNERQRQAIELAFDLFQGRVDSREPPGSVLVSLLDGVLGGVEVWFSLRMLQPCEGSAALDICSRLRQQHAETSFLIDLLEGYLMLAAGNVAEARVRAEPLTNDSRLPPYDLTRLLVRCDLAEGAVGAAIGRLKQAWLQPTTPAYAGLELANLLMSDARPSEATAICRGLETRVSSPELRQMIAILDPMWAALEAVPPYELSENGVLLKPDGDAATISDEVAGCVDLVHVEDDLVFFRGWAVDLKMRGPVRRVVALVNGIARGTATPAMQRPDVAAVLQLREAEASGYLMAARLPAGSMPHQADVRVFAIAADGAARELQLPAAYPSKATAGADQPLPH